MLLGNGREEVMGLVKDPWGKECVLGTQKARRKKISW